MTGPLLSTAARERPIVTPVLAGLAGTLMGGAALPADSICRQVTGPRPKIGGVPPAFFPAPSGAFQSAVMVVLLGLSMAIAPGAGFAGLAAQQEQGDVELQLVASFLSTVGQDDRSFSTGILQAKGGYFLTDRVEVGAFPSVVFTRTRVRVGGVWLEESETKIGFGVFSTYSFLAADAATVPYLGGQFYRIDLTDDDETGWAGVSAGFKHYLSRSTAVDVGGDALHGLGDGGGMLILFRVGLSFLF